jgi:hypothetical protein
VNFWPFDILFLYSIHIVDIITIITYEPLFLFRCAYWIPRRDRRQYVDNCGFHMKNRNSFKNCFFFHNILEKLFFNISDSPYSGFGIKLCCCLKKSGIFTFKKTHCRAQAFFADFLSCLLCCMGYKKGYRLYLLYPASGSGSISCSTKKYTIWATAVPRRVFFHGL